MTDKPTRCATASANGRRKRASDDAAGFDEVDLEAGAFFGAVVLRELEAEDLGPDVFAFRGAALVSGRSDGATASESCRPVEAPRHRVEARVSSTAVSQGRSR